MNRSRGMRCFAALILGSNILFCTGRKLPANIVDVTAVEAGKLVAENRGNPDFVILDVRTPQEYASGHIAGAVLIDFTASGFSKKVSALDRSKTYLVYCRSGRRSNAAIQSAFAGRKFSKIYNLRHGILAWTGQGLPVER